MSQVSIAIRSTPIFRCQSVDVLFPLAEFIDGFAKVTQQYFSLVKGAEQSSSFSIWILYYINGIYIKSSVVTPQTGIGIIETDSAQIRELINRDGNLRFGGLGMWVNQGETTEIRANLKSFKNTRLLSPFKLHSFSI